MGQPGAAPKVYVPIFGPPISGSIAQITDTIAGFADVGMTRVEVVAWPPKIGVLEQLAPVFSALT